LTGPTYWFLVAFMFVISTSPFWFPVMMRRKRMAIEKKYEKLRGLID